MSKVSIPIHAVISTRLRQMTIKHENREALYRFMWSILKEKNCHLYRIGGIPNHVHILFDLTASHALKDVMWDLKRRSSWWMKRSNLFPEFSGWGKEYFAFSRSRESLDDIIEYIKSQPDHHRIITFEDEARELFRAETIEWDDRILT